MDDALNLDAYRARIAHAGPLAPTLETLFALHRAHATAIPFENLAIQLGELPLRLDLPSLQDKLVTRRRGGYCFEQNTLFRAVLERVGFEVMACEARVRYRSPEVLPRTHMTLVVRAGQGEWLCDVGFGASGLLEPVPMDGAESPQGFEPLRLREEGSLKVLQACAFGVWEDLYAFVPEPRLPVDFEMANWYTSTHPDSRFVRTLTAQRIAPEARRVLRGTGYAVTTAQGLVESRDVPVEELPALLREAFGLEVPEGATFSCFRSGRGPVPDPR